MLTEKDLEYRQRIAIALNNRLASLRPGWRKNNLAKVALQFNARISTGFYSSPEIEKTYTDLADTFDVKDDGQFEKDTCLIVTTRTYNVGGHTRVIERWIESDKTRRYSLVQTSHDLTCVPERLSSAIRDSGGRLFSVFSRDSLVNRARELRKLSLKYETVLLFLLEEDVLPLIAYGTKSFYRPVGLYNHIDHLYWTGVSIADYVADMRPWGYELSHSNRGIADSMIVPVPVETRKDAKLVNRVQARAQLGLDCNMQLVVSCGREVKYKASAKGSFIDIVLPLLSDMPDLMVVCIGMDFGDFPDWQFLSARFPNRFKLIKRLPHDEVLVYYQAADLVLDSFPMDGIAALEDAVVCGCPILSSSETIDWVAKSPSSCASKEEIVSRAKMLLVDKHAAHELWNETKLIMEEMAGVTFFVKQLDEFLAKLRSKTHDVHCFYTVPTHFVANDYMREDQVLNASKKPEFLARLSLVRPFALADLLVCFIGVFVERLRWVVKYVKILRK